MGKISPVSAKYIVHSKIQIDGVVDRPDVIGAIFGQTEGLLGEDLELRELQRSGRIGRIDVRTETRAGKTSGEITIPSSLDKAETAIIGAAIETIQRIGPCNAKVRIEKVEDVRISKRNYVIERAKELLKTLTDDILPDSQEITEEVSQSVRMMEIAEFGRERLPAGPSIEESEEIILVEGRADVLNLLKNGFKNAIALNGTSVPEEIKELSKKKSVILFVDGDRGGDLIIREVSSVAEVDYVIKAPDGKEVEEMTKKEIHKSLRSKIAIEQIKLEKEPVSHSKPQITNHRPREIRHTPREVRHTPTAKIPSEKAKEFKRMLENLIGTRGAYILDDQLNILGKVPVTELTSTLRSLSTGVFAIIFDGIITRDITNVAERNNIKYIVGMDSRASSTQVGILTAKQL